MSRFICQECHHGFPEAQALVVPYGEGFTEFECPLCYSPHIDEYADDPVIGTLPQITVRPVSTANLEAEARKVMARMAEET